MKKLVKLSENGGVMLFVAAGVFLLSVSYIVVQRIIISSEKTSYESPTEQPWSDVHSQETVHGEDVPELINPNTLAPPEQPQITTAEQKGSVVEVVSRLGAKYTGRCYYRFQNGNTIIERQNSTSNLDTCYITVPAQELLVTGDWTVTVHFQAEFENNTKFTQQPVSFSVFF